jgi:signal transduction histidine kinase
VRARTTIAFAAVTAVVTAVSALVAYERIRVDAVSEREQVALRQTYANARIIRARLRGDAPDAGAVLVSVESGQGTPVLYFDGEWFAASVGASRSEIPEAVLRVVNDGHSAHQRVRLGGRLAVIVGVPVPAVSAAYYEFVELSDVEATLRSVRRSLAIGAALATIVGGVLGLLASRAVLRPIRAIAAAAGEVSSGNLDAHVGSTGIPDLDPLIDSFNSMMDELRIRIERDARFAGDVTHELRGPLAALAAASNRARRHVERREELLESLDYLDENVEQFSSLVIDLLEMSRMDAGVAELNLESLETTAFINAVVAAGRWDLPVLLTEEAPLRFIADKRRLGQCVTNLLQNADRYAGGATGISVTGNSTSLLIHVDDSGQGVPEHERDYIFGRFARGSTAAESAAGTGLGLALVAEHVRLHGGSVSVGESSSGGARFTLTIPVGGST